MSAEEMQSCIIDQTMVPPGKVGSLPALDGLIGLPSTAETKDCSCSPRRTPSAG